MTLDERNDIKAKILIGIEVTNKSIADLEELTKPIAPDDAIGRITRMEAINSKSIHEASLNQARAKLNKLERALGRVEEDDFGNCAVCEKPIPVKRMMLMPEAIKCVNCAE